MASIVIVTYVHVAANLGDGNQCGGVASDTVGESRSSNPSLDLSLAHVAGGAPGDSGSGGGLLTQFPIPSGSGAAGGGGSGGAVGEPPASSTPRMNSPGSGSGGGAGPFPTQTPRQMP